MIGHEATTGELDFHPRPPDAEEPGAVGIWMPDYDRRADDVIYPINHVLTVWWGNRDADGLIYPLFLREHEAGWRVFAGRRRGRRRRRPQGGQPGRRDRRRAPRPSPRRWRGTERFERVQPVLIRAETAYELDDERRVCCPARSQGTPLEGASYVNFSINHNTAPTRMALGANGCEDCHVEEAHFFKGQRVPSPSTGPTVRR